MNAIDFKITGVDANSRARRGKLITPHGVVQTPAFMPVGTKASVKALTPGHLEAAGTQILLSNTYHLHVRPGEDVIAEAGGLHSFMGWEKPILTDSGGFQVFSLAKLNKVDDAGVMFQSHVDGAKLFIGPKEATGIQEKLGADIIMAFDQCPPHDASRAEVEAATQRTIRWAGECRKHHSRNDQALFGIVQGGMFEDLRTACCRELSAMDFPGYAIGGVSVGEPKEDLHRIMEFTTPLLPEDKPRYLMGVGQPEDILVAVRAGVDLFDCVLPTRNARSGELYVAAGRMKIRNEKFKRDFTPVEKDCPCYLCSNFTRAYLRHLFISGELLAHTLATVHNVTFYHRLMSRLRAAIQSGRLGEEFGKKSGK
ncbi:MAG: tRNA guanosine(34) transglycosylase Tgt [Planctomycetota bacterium]|nr:MAG: tRNA guanosine(34) transglycosylase Tgt [Planctomycetota bacterium]